MKFFYSGLSVYEGVADFFAYCLTDKTRVGSDKCWFSRTIFDYNNFDDAKNPENGTLDIAVNALKTLEFDNKYKAYKQWLDLVTSYVGSINEDPYTMGSVVAKKLYEKSSLHQRKRSSQE